MKRGMIPGEIQRRWKGERDLSGPHLRFNVAIALCHLNEELVWAKNLRRLR